MPKAIENRVLHLRMTRTLMLAVDHWAVKESRSRANMINRLIEEALTARIARPDASS